ncbi:MAG: NAD(P)(+) transhydrogenase (Re/Si-specific) subunit beta [Bacteroidales bacterium]|jgi:NAD(P) transhydrogenase subunit beta|nr:NAD(P)(+) transhydrogenase (Re/Si-specific) subunit beta [Bacteroidales bacterium]NCU35323.1 NAD(P)(+) transhydrogenase (Re/Si-specific) subunit beta [Candidatus Falkowbacteria bacterium]MDD2633226.1 NAD(P)(+) transhydrogenase (Re/Si-specific) subunit beta [Bacteroidales bacterium]MDD3526468.1 NAD(P)(+) transhydrogenase (Re/Si-specific) subunit beta [Bacteroidales bacterium]MDD4177700.1 NAD(P)(+) transhydrogenase (Re/Si-specific) subunit beta [Bacteroidales bacterium]
MDQTLQTLNGVSFILGDAVLEFSYLLSAIFFVVGLKLLSHPRTARKGNFYAAGAMVLAMITTLFLYRNPQGETIGWMSALVIIITILLGSVVGMVISRRVKMTAMPELVSFFNATGGAASALVGLLEFGNPENESLLVTLLGLIIGSIAFSGSLIAYGKLAGKIGNINAQLMKWVNMLVLAALVGATVYVLVQPAPQEYAWLVYLLFAASVIYGIMFVLPIGGADMPVVISLLNSLTGIAAAMAGFIYNNLAMILGGIFVGAAGSILTVLMTKAMNRSLLNVIIGGFGAKAGGAAGDESGSIKEMTMSDAAVLLAYSKSVVVVPGYGLAVAQAQHTIHELEKVLQEKGVQVRYGIHPVAGRMPGHMNVLLAEADVSYEKLVEMDEINKDMATTDVVIVVGANDVVNPAANETPGSPIYGMPVINAAQAKNVIVMKRGMGKGYAGIENPLFYKDNTRMLFGNAKDTLAKLTGEINSL